MLDVVEDLFLAEVDEDCVLLDFEPVDLQEDVVLLVLALGHQATVRLIIIIQSMDGGRTHRLRGGQAVSGVLGSCSMLAELALLARGL